MSATLPPELDRPISAAVTGNVGASIQAFSDDPARFLFSSEFVFAPGATAGKANLYDYDHGSASFVGRVPVFPATSCDDESGPAWPVPAADGAAASAANVISADGSRSSSPNPAPAGSICERAPKRPRSPPRRRRPPTPTVTSPPSSGPSVTPARQILLHQLREAHRRLHRGLHPRGQLHRCRSGLRPLRL